MIIVDTSVWIDHLRQSNPELEEALLGNSILLHAFVLGEIALGSISNRRDILEEMQQMPFANKAEEDEIIDLIEREHFFGSGIGYVDAHLIASTLLQTDCKLWTRDKRLEAIAHRLGIAYQPMH